MNAPPMRTWQNLAALLATVVAAGALLPTAPPLRLLCAGIAGVLVVWLLAMRMRAHRVRRERDAFDDVYARIARIRAARTCRRERR
ncbi:hypothetical protein WPS_24880 [Vulcanimicrobium alpinum]|uniref:Uncharacterized protein n=1 Tax=Vulcanimicrobium alpinum TaxID=3016050 RepID=A0AAN2CB15_UNVUL|nr:hypothetical protein [Vulcanimicrobium alpinum]BDE07212.1 hypothetical protein WPS_24880 [Vulcanimicrobium alpinum]